MKLNKIALASLFCLAGSAFAGTTPAVKPKDVECDKSDSVKFVTTCKPALTFVIAGSSALGDSVEGVLTTGTSGGTSTAAGYFDQSVVPLVSIIDIGTPNGVSVLNDTNIVGTTKKAGQGVTAWYGMSRAALTGGTSLPVLIVYNKYMGSAAGVSSLLAADITKVPEAKLVTVGPVLDTRTKVLVANTSCSELPSDGITPAGETATSKIIAKSSTKVQCSSNAFTKADIALSDVDIPELAAVYDTAKGNLTATNLAKFTRKPLAMQGFGIAVNKNFYMALQAAQIASGKLPNCSASTASSVNYTEACQPSISRAQYASLVTKEGGIKSAAGFISGDTTLLTLARRDELSGTQASSNIYFAGTVCNKTGALTPIRATDSTTGVLKVNENIQTDSVVADLSDNTNGYVIGMITLARSSSDYYFLKLDGVSPNFAKGGTAAYSSATNLRKNMVDGSWGLQMTAYAAYLTSQTGLTSPKASLISSFIADMSSASLTDLKALSYFNGTGENAAKQTKVSRLNGSNCSPLINRTN